MAKKNIGKSLKNTFQGAVGSVKTAAKDVKLPEIKAPKIKTPKIKAPDIKMPSQMKDAFKKKEKKQAPVDKQADTLAISVISTKSALKIIYYVMVVDGKIDPCEEEKFDLVCAELDPEFAGNREPIINECRKQMDKTIDPDDYYDVIQEGVRDALLSYLAAKDTVLTPKLLVWNLLSIAYSDGNYDVTQRKLIKYIVRELDIDKAVLLEMENSFLTLMDIDKELNWIKTTNRPYLTIEAMVNEITDRKNVIYESVQDLISL